MSLRVCTYALQFGVYNNIMYVIYRDQDVCGNKDTRILFYILNWFIGMMMVKGGVFAAR